MDLYVEKQSVDQLRIGNGGPFLLLFDAYFDQLLKYVRRRVFDPVEAQKIAKNTLLDAVNQLQNTPQEIGYLVWLFSLAKGRVWEVLAVPENLEKSSFLIIDDQNVELDDESKRYMSRFEGMMKKLSLEEREIIRLKFFEEVTDGDVMFILSLDQSNVGSKIYRVLKRVHLLLFGDVEGRQGIYFGELSAFFARIRELERVFGNESFKLSLKAELANKINQKDFAIDAELIEEQKAREEAKIIRENLRKDRTGANDPAKIYVDAVKEMRAEQEAKMDSEEDENERAPIFGLLRTGFVFGIVFLICLLLWKFLDVGRVIRDLPVGGCKAEIVYQGGFTEEEKKTLDKQVNSPLCSEFAVDGLILTRLESNIIRVNVKREGDDLEYLFVERANGWRVNKYTQVLAGM